MYVSITVLAMQRNMITHLTLYTNKMPITFSVLDGTIVFCKEKHMYFTKNYFDIR